MKRISKLHQQFHDGFNTGQGSLRAQIEQLETENKQLKTMHEKEEAIIKMLQACSSMQESCARLVMSIEKYG